MLGLEGLEDVLVEMPRSSELWQGSGPGHRALVVLREAKGRGMAEFREVGMW